MLGVGNGGSFVSAVTPTQDRTGPAWWFAFRDERLLILDHADGSTLPFITDLAEIGLGPLRTLYLGRLDGVECFAAALPAEAQASDGYAFRGIRALFGALPDDLLAVAGRATQLLTWERTHRFCGQCGSPTEHLAGERAMKCPSCGHIAYPRLSPAVIVQVTRGEEILLARGLNFADGMYSTPAGFVEPGETLEEAVAREIHEELGISVRDIRYFASQPWPFPHQLMVGFTAVWAAGEITIDPSELADARWFTRGTMPTIPTPISISRRLIDHYLHGAP
ncbi:MAG TPA: NAD(+) diphosphatase [Chloroflexota bacterium]|nr:NAD(+) diphosphatase [Chloroflexota bacterium]